MTPEEQNLHDRVVLDSAASYLKVTTKENIKTNISTNQENAIDGKYPDVIVKMPAGEYIIEEVEIESTINDQRVAYWQELASLGHELRLIVPMTKLETAKKLSRMIANINIQAYDASGENIIWIGKNT